MTTAGKLTIAISSRALFDLAASNEVYENEGLSAYRRYQICLLYTSDAADE